MTSVQNTSISQPQLNDKKEIMNDDKKMNFLREKKKTMDVYRGKRKTMGMYREKKKTMDLYRKKRKNVDINSEKKTIEMNSDKKKSMYMYRPRITKISTKGKRQISMNSPFALYNKFSKITNSKISNSKIELNSSRGDLEIDYEDIGQGIKNAILEMKNDALFEIKRQSCDRIESFKNKFQLKNKLNNTNTKESINDKDEKPKKKIRATKTHFDKNHMNLKINKSYTSNKNEINNSSKTSNNSKIINYKKGSGNIKISTKSSIFKTEIKSNFSERFGFYGSGGVREDSFDESETDEEEYEEDPFLINPETTTFLIYDIIIFIASLYSLIIIPYDILKECFCYGNKKNTKFYLNYGIDILYIIDLIINFFLEYYSKRDKLIKNRMKIINNYLTGWFFFDFVTALPFNILYYYYCKYYPNKICYAYEKNNIGYYLVFLKYLKSIKIFKMTAEKKNQFISRIIEVVSNKSSLIEKIDLIIELLLALFGLHILSCIHMFIGRYTYPGWIFANELQDFPLSNIYMISIYYLIQTMTTVGYGDISSDSFIEIIFRIILLAVGIICYSWLISNISNSINKESYASVNFSNDLIFFRKN